MEGDVVYVNESDEAIGQGTIQNATENGIIMRIARVLLVDGSGELVMQQRSPEVRDPLKWNESATGHVDVGETYEEAAYRELEEEIGVAEVMLSEIGTVYCEEPTNGHLKKGFHTLFVGLYDGEVSPDENEVHHLKRMPVGTVKEWLKNTPDDFTLGARKSLEMFFGRFSQQSSN